MDAYDLFQLTIDTNNPKSLIINPNTIDLNFKECNSTENCFILLGVTQVEITN